MKDYRLVLSLLLRNQYRRKAGKYKISQGLLVAVCCLPLEAVICVALHFLTGVCADYGIVPELMNLLVTAAELMIFFFVIQSIITVLYMTDDSAFMSSLPVRPSAVFFARLTQVYISELAIAAYLLFPMLLTVGITAAGCGAAVSPAFYPLTVLIVAVAPLLPLAVATLLSLPLMWLSSFFRKRAVFSTVALILLFAVVFTAYFFIVPNFGAVSDIESLSEQTVKFFRTFATVMYPNKVMVEFAMGINAGVNFAVFAAIWLALGGIILGLSSLFYRRAVTAGMESGSAVTRVRHTVTPRRNQVVALMLNDFKSLIRFPSLAVSSCINIVLAPIMTCVMFTVMNADSEGAVLGGGMLDVGLIMLYSVLLNGGTNNVAALAFTREGQSFFISQHLPISAKSAVSAKFLLASAFTLVGVIPLFVIAVALVKIHVVNALLYVLILLIACTGLNCLSIYTDMKRPIFDWKNTTDIQKNNFRVMLPFVIGLAIGVVILVLAAVISPLAAEIGETGAYAVFWSVAFVLTGAICGGCAYVLFDRCDELYARMAENSQGIRKPRSGSGIGQSGGFGGRRRGGGMLG